MTLASAERTSYHHISAIQVQVVIRIRGGDVDVVSLELDGLVKETRRLQR